MEPINQNKDLFDQQQTTGLPGMLNVLTILTFIGCGLSYLFSINGLFYYILIVEGKKQK